MDSTTENSPRTQGGRSRKKSCVQCAKAKARCNLQRPACRRCVTTKKQCKYTTPPEPVSPPQTASETASRGSLRPSVAVASPGGLSNALTEGLVARNQAISASPKFHFATTPARGGDDAHLYHANLDLIPLDDAEQIRHRWMRQFLAAPEQPHKNFHPHTLQYISCVLRVYPKQMAEDDGIPPFIHPMQTTPGGMAVSLANCYSLVRMWHHRAPMSEDVVVEAIQREMARLECLGPDTGHLETLAAFQAYLIYSILLYSFPLQHGPVINDTTMMTLQELAFRSAQSGLLLRAELCHAPPDWESWVVVAAKRRTLFVFYLFSSLYNADNQVPNTLAEELREVYVPDAKRLWAATTRSEWEREYRRHLCRWEDGQLKISELWRSPDTGTAARRERIDRWVETADEFGMMLLAVCVHIHGY